MGAHQPHLGLGVPDQDVSQGSAQSLNWPGGDQPNILPLDLTFTFKTLYFDVNIFTFSFFALGPHLIADQYVGRASS